MDHYPASPSPDQVQHDIDADGGLYDQALREDHDRARDAQDRAYDTYIDNIELSAVHEDQRIKELQKQKRKLTLRAIGQAALWIPGVDVIGEMARESRTSARLHKERRTRYKQKTGHRGIDLKSKWDADNKTRTDRRLIIEELGYLLEERRRRDGNLTGAN